MIRFLEQLEDEEFPWVEVDDKLKEILEKQVRIEISKSHELFQIKDGLIAVAKCEANDDALFIYEDNYYVIHLTWAKGNSKYPRYDIVNQEPHTMGLFQQEKQNGKTG